MTEPEMATTAPTTANTSLSRYARVVALVWLAVLLVVCARVAVSPQRQSSYAKDYAPAGRHWLQGAEIYSHRHHFVYSPPVAACFAVFAALPGAAGDVLWRLSCGLLLFGAAIGWQTSPLSGLGGRAAPRPKDASCSTGLLLLLPLAVGNLNLGQMNVLVLVLAVAGVLALAQERWNAAAALLAAVAYLKIYPLAVGLLFALLYPRQFSWRLILALLGWFAVSLVLQRPPYVWAEYHHWFTVLGHDDRLDVDLYATWRDFGYLLRAVGVPLSDRAYRIMEVASGGALAVFLWLGQRRGHWSKHQLLGGTFGLACAWMMLFGPATEAATYIVLALPVCGLLVATWTAPAGNGFPAWRTLLTAVYALLLLADVANGWFHGLTHHLFMRALQPVAALLFAGGVVWRLRGHLPDASIDSMLSHAHDHDKNGGGDRRVD